MKIAATALFASVVCFVSALPAPVAQSATAGEIVVHSFAIADGAYPDAALIKASGTLYGTTFSGGGAGCTDHYYGCGTVFSLDPATGAEKVIYSFCSQHDCTDGQGPFAGVIEMNGTLYGTTNWGGAHGYGTVYALDPKTGAETVLHSFGSGKDGFTPFAGLIAMNGLLYGTTQAGGESPAKCCGTVYSVDPKTGAEAIVYSFCHRRVYCIDGANPLGGVIAVNGFLYGTTAEGGAHGERHGGAGTVFAVDPNSGTEKVVYSFCGQPNCTDGRYPQAGLIAVNGLLYGTTSWGGAKTDCAARIGCGTVFALDPGSGAETALYSFCSQQNCADGFQPVASLIGVKGTLYGTTLYGGDKPCGLQYRRLRCGTLFALDTTTGTERVLYSFCGRHGCTDGKYPVAGLTQMDGTLYGTTVDGGASGYGAVFALKP